MQSDYSVLVIGSNSFSGNDFIEYLLSAEQYNVIGVSRSSNKYPELSQNPRFQFYKADLNLDFEKLFLIIRLAKPKFIVNFAAQSEVAPSWETPTHWVQTNVLSLTRLYDFLCKTKCQARFLQISSPEMYGSTSSFVTEENAKISPSTPYAASKAAGDMMAQVLRKQYGFPVIFLRATNVFGEKQQPFKLIPSSVLKLLRNRKIQLHGGGVAVKSYIYIRDVSRATRIVMERGEEGAVYHVSPNHRGHSVKSIVEKICHLMNKSFEESCEIVDERPGQDAAYTLDSSKVRALGWAPQVDLHQGLEKVVEYLRTNESKITDNMLSYNHTE